MVRVKTRGGHIIIWYLLPIITLSTGRSRTDAQMRSGPASVSINGTLTERPRTGRGPETSTVITVGARHPFGGR